MFAKLAAASTFLVLPALAFGAPPTTQWNAVVEKATAFLVAKQNLDGSWGEAPRNMGITGVVVTGLLQSGKTADDPAVAKGLKFIEGLVNA